ncbi:peroxiredoxin, partial [bacterium]|nr:peroxiredoxin [bacterium]
RQKYHLPFDLLIDKDGSLAKSFGVGMMPVIGLHQRQSILIDSQGKIAKFYSSVDPKEHSQEVLAELDKMSH